MKNLTYQDCIPEDQTRTLYRFYAHEKPSVNEMTTAITKKSLHSAGGTRVLHGVQYEVVNVKLADGWEDAE